MRYVLEPWRDNHVIRVSEVYDQANEERREREYAAAVARNRGRKTANLFGIFTGHLPASVQRQLGSELGILPSKLTRLSLLLPLGFIAWFAHYVVRHEMDPNLPRVPSALFFVALYVLAETGVRFYIAWMQDRPVGSAAGGIVYLLFYVVAGRRMKAASPFEVEKGFDIRITSPDEETALRDAYSMREPLLTLLSPEEQQALEQRFGFDYRVHAFAVAWVLLALSAAGAISSLVSLQEGPRFSAILSLVLALGIGGEQIRRLPALKRGPTESVLAGIVRPFTRKLLR